MKEKEEEEKREAAEKAERAKYDAWALKELTCNPCSSGDLKKAND